MILEIYKDAFGYALKDGSTLLKLGVLSLFSFLIIPFIFLLGYEYRIIKTATEGMINGNETLPEFNNYTTMFKDGLKVLAVSIIYILISVVIFLLLFFIGLTTNMESIIVLAFIALIILTIISLIFSALAVTHMAANNGSINAAFHIRELKDIMQSIGVLKLVGSYFGIFLISAVISFVVYVFSPKENRSNKKKIVFRLLLLILALYVLFRLDIFGIRTYWEISPLYERLHSEVQYISGDENRLSEIDTSTLNNLIHFSKVYVDTVSPLTTSNAKKTVILELTKEIEKLETLLNNQEISPKR